ncbi:TPA: hypothetical protein ACGOVI_001355 [Streptococcus suis]
MNIDDWVKEKFDSNPLVKALRRRAILRKFLTLLVMVSMWLSLLLGAWFSPQRVKYTEDQLATEREFANSTGMVELTEQSYDPDSGVVLLSFETTDYTSAITKGINVANLSWELYTKVGTTNSTLQVIPLTNNKIFVIISDIPKGFEALAVNIYNNTPPINNIDISVKDYQEETEKLKKDHTENPQASKEEVVDNLAQFIVTEQSNKLNTKTLDNLSREEFALSLFEDELKFEKGQKSRLEESISQLEQGIVGDKKTLEDLHREAQYIVGTALTKQYESIERVENSIEEKEKKISQAKENIEVVQSLIDNLEISIQAVKDGSYQFNAPVQSIEMNF